MAGDTRAPMSPSSGDESVDAASLRRVIAPLLEDPDRAAVLTDIDGTIAPIVADPTEASVPRRTRDLLAELARRYALVAALSGRRAEDARRVVGLDELTYSGNHGFELLLPGDSEPRPDPSLDGHEADASSFVEGLDPSELDRAGIRAEDKGAIFALHWRGAPNEAAAESLANEIASEAERRGLVPHQGRKVLEIRPNVPINKGIALASLIPAQPVDAALYGGDDRTDVDAFTALRTLQHDGQLSATACIGVASEESPPEVSGEADLVVRGPEGFAAVLEALADR